jgi:flavin-dependent dehydrogenase
MANRSDVLIVGAGPSGCAAAIQSARTGLSVRLLERAAFPRCRPGETLHPGAEVLFETLGVMEAVRRAGFIRHSGILVGWNTPPEFKPFGAHPGGPWRGFQACGDQLDAFLLEEAIKHGVRVHKPCLPDATVAGRREVVVRAGTDEFRARYVIDATGGRHWLARKLSIPIERHTRPLVARYGYCAGKLSSFDEAPSIVADETGWTWMAHVKEDVYNWTRLSLVQERLPANWKPEAFGTLQLGFMNP